MYVGGSSSLCVSVLTQLHGPDILIKRNGLFLISVGWVNGHSARSVSRAVRYSMHRHGPRGVWCVSVSACVALGCLGY